MATLTPDRFCTVADGGRVLVDVDPTPHGDAELFQRTVRFGSTTASAPPPPWRRVAQVFSEGGPTRHTVSAPVGSLYQARLYPKGVVPAGQQPTDRDQPIGRIDLPCLNIETRQPLLTRCRGDRAQLLLDVGDTWLGATVGTGRETTRMMLLVGAEEPAEFATGQGPWPRFGERTPLASAASPGNARLHRLYAPPRVALSEDEGIDPQQAVYYLAVVWTADGRWDYVWADDGIGGTGTPQAVLTGTREISAKVTRLTCIDDSFEDDFGVGWKHVDAAPGAGDDSADFSVVDDDGLFDLVLVKPGYVALARGSYLWEDMDDGEVVVPPQLEFDWSGGAEARDARIYVGSGGCHGEIDVPMATGEGVRASTHQVRVAGRLADGSPGFFADLTVTVGYR